MSAFEYSEELALLVGRKSAASIACVQLSRGWVRLAHYSCRTASGADGRFSAATELFNYRTSAASTDTLDRPAPGAYSTSSRVPDRTIAMVAKDLHEFGFAGLAPLILKPLRRMRGVTSPTMAERMGVSTRAYQDFENGRTGLLLTRIRLFAEILKLDHFAILAAFQLGKPRIAHVFAQNKFMLIQASSVDEFDEEMQDAIAAVDPLTVLDAHIQFYRQLAEVGRAQLRAADGTRTKD